MKHKMLHCVRFIDVRGIYTLPYFHAMEGTKEQVEGAIGFWAEIQLHYQIWYATISDRAGKL